MDAVAVACLSGAGASFESRDMTAGTDFPTKAILSLWRYRHGAAAFIANRTRIPFNQCRDIVEWNWPILVEAHDAGARFVSALSRPRR